MYIRILLLQDVYDIIWSLLQNIAINLKYFVALWNHKHITCWIISTNYLIHYMLYGELDKINELQGKSSDFTMAFSVNYLYLVLI